LKAGQQNILHGQDSFAVYRFHMDSSCSAFYLDFLYLQKEFSGLEIFSLETWETFDFYDNLGAWPFMLDNPYPPNHMEMLTEKLRCLSR
jgi:hypothetical protein